jgi:hypothetical protein
MATVTLPPAPYPATHAERVAWLQHGTPATLAPYVPEARDDYRDGLLRGALAAKKAREP